MKHFHYNTEQQNIKQSARKDKNQNNPTIHQKIPILSHKKIQKKMISTY